MDLYIQTFIYLHNFKSYHTLKLILINLWSWSPMWNHMRADIVIHTPGKKMYRVIFKVQVKASTSIVKVFALPFEVICINQILGTSVKYYKRNNSRAKYYSSFTTWKCLSCSVVHHLFLVFIIHVKQIMQEFSKLWWPIPPPLPKKN